MRKLLSAVILSAFIACMLLCSCNAEPTKASSAPAKEESQYSETETSSIFNYVETSSEESSSEESSSDEVSTSSKKESSSSKEASTSSENKVPSKIEKPRPTVSRVSSETESDKVKIPVKNTRGIGAYHFNYKWTTNYGTSSVNKILELNDVISQGYFNTLMVERGFGAMDPEFWRICVENDVSVWYMLFSYFDSSKETIEEYIARFDEEIQFIRQKDEWWDNFCGFAFDESVWRGQTNEDFLTECKALYQKYGKRNFPVLATPEYSDNAGNFAGTEFEERKMTPEALKYVTDIAFDSYGSDVRDGAPTDGKKNYRNLTNELLDFVGHPVNVWFYPCAYTVRLSGGLNGIMRADEDYCIAHLEFFDELLKEQEYQGGLYLYTYTQFGDDDFGLQSHLKVTDKDGNVKLRPEEKKWARYSTLVKRLTAEYKGEEVTLLHKIK